MSNWGGNTQTSFSLREPIKSHVSGFLFCRVRRKLRIMTRQKKAPVSTSYRLKLKQISKVLTCSSLRLYGQQLEDKKTVTGWCGLSFFHLQAGTNGVTSCFHTHASSPSYALVHTDDQLTDWTCSRLLAATHLSELHPDHAIDLDFKINHCTHTQTHTHLYMYLHAFFDLLANFLKNDIFIYDHALSLWTWTVWLAWKSCINAAWAEDRLL